MQTAGLWHTFCSNSSGRVHSPAGCEVESRRATQGARGGAKQVRRDGEGNFVLDDGMCKGCWETLGRSAEVKKGTWRSAAAWLGEVWEGDVVRGLEGLGEAWRPALHHEHAKAEEQ
eukprot:2214697-Alexandrium_andersonii.AAC.1